MHINYLEDEGKLEDAFNLADINGFHGIELRGFDRYDKMPDREYLELIRNIQKKHPGLDVTFGLCSQFTDNDENTREANAERIISQLKRMKDIFDLSFVNFTAGNVLDPEKEYDDFANQGSGIAREWQWKVSAELMWKVAEAAASLNIQLAIETHPCYLHDTAEAAKKFLELIGHPNAGINFDYGNIFAHPRGETLADALNILKSHIFYFHFKNIIKVGNFCFGTFLDSGMIDHHKYLEIISDWSYNGSMALEFPACGDRILACRKDIEYFREKAGLVNLIRIRNTR